MRPFSSLPVAALAIALSLAFPLSARASLNGDLKSLPGDASPKQACNVLIKDGAIKRAQEGHCRKLVAKGFTAAKTVSHSGTVTIASAAACAIQVLHGKLKSGQMEDCSKTVAESASEASGGGGGGGFDPIGAVGDAIGGALGGIGEAIGGAVTGTILDGFKAIINLLFGGLQSAITVALIKWMTTIPNLSGGHVGSLERSIAVGAGGLLAATMTISIVRFWSSGLTGDGAWAGAEGVARAAIAAALIGLWPQIFDLAVRLSNALQSGILGGGVQGQLKALFRDLDVIGLGGGALTGGVVPMFLAIVIAIVGILMLLALVAMKIVITALTIVLFVAMPLALVVWPIQELSGLTRFCLRSLGAALAVPVVWCLIFGAFAAIGADTFSFHNTGKDQGIFGTALNVTIVRPLVAIALLYLALVVPRRLLQVVPFFSGRPGAIRHIGTGMAVRAGFSYAPQAGRMALGRAQAVGSTVASRWGGGGAGAGSGGAVASAGGAANANRGTAATPAGGVGKSERSSQAPRDSRPAGQGGAQSREPKGEAKAEGRTVAQTSGPSQSERSSQTSGAQQGGGKTSGNATKGNEPHEQAMERGQGPFGGPRTPDRSLTPERIEAIGKRSEAMAADSASGTAVTRSQVNAAVSDLQNRPALLEAARKAAYHGDAEQATGAFAEWSLSDNPHVSDQHRSAFGVLGRASPSQRRVALGPADGGGGIGGGSGGGSSSGPPGTGGGGERRVPTSKPQSASPSPPRTPHRQPRRPRGG